MTNNDQNNPLQNRNLDIYGLMSAQARQLHHQIMTMTTRPMGNPGYDHFLSRVASYQRARTAQDYAIIVTQCTQALDTLQLAEDMRACYTWLAWIARWQLEAIVDRQ